MKTAGVVDYLEYEIKAKKAKRERFLSSHNAIYREARERIEDACF